MVSLTETEHKLNNYFRLTLDNRANVIVPAPLKSNRARINVSGTKFETFFATLEKYPGKKSI